MGTNVPAALQSFFSFPCGQQSYRENRLHKEIGTLKAGGKFFMDGLFDDAGTGEADERVRLGDVHVAEHGETGRSSRP